MSNLEKVKELLEQYESPQEFSVEFLKVWVEACRTETQEDIIKIHAVARERLNGADLRQACHDSGLVDKMEKENKGAK